ncbi:MAG TPA: glycosyltransferase family 87 protein [Terriglobales bacterium]|nr:glycosyltransferase family 87 protein [Terriglobales bacterium]
MTAVSGHRPSTSRYVLLLMAAVMAASMLFYVQRILIPYQIADAAAHNRPRGTLSDLYPRWVGVRDLLLKHQDPYSDEVTREIQLGYYGKVLDPNRPDDPKDEQRFAYPVYVAFLLAPTVKLPFSVVRSAFSWLLLLLTALTVPLWLKFLRWRISGIASVTLVLLALSTYAAVQGIKLQQLSLLAGGLIAISAALLAGGHLVLAGVLLAIASIKPQLVALPAVWFCLWSVSRWRERRNFVIALFATMAALVFGGQLLLPGWISRFLDGLRAYARYTGAVSLLDLLATRAGGTILNGLIVLGTAVVCWRARKSAVDSQVFIAVSALVLLVTVLVVPMIAPYNQVLLLPAVFLLMRSWKEFVSDRGIGRIVFFLAAFVFLWQWIASLALTLAALVLPAATVQKAWAVPLWTSIAVPLVVLPLLATLLRRIMRSQFGVSSADAATHSF